MQRSWSFSVSDIDEAGASSSVPGASLSAETSLSSLSLIRSSRSIPGLQAVDSTPSMVIWQLAGSTAWPALQIATALKPSCSVLSQHDFAAMYLPEGTSPFELTPRTPVVLG